VIKTGISAWTEKTLVESGWYPMGARSAEARLRYYASRFPIVENDGTYYALPSARQAELWSERTPDGFTMNVKRRLPCQRALPPRDAVDRGELNAKSQRRRGAKRRGE